MCRAGLDTFIASPPERFPGYSDATACPVQCGASQYEIISDGDLSANPSSWVDEDCDGEVGETDAILSDLDCTDGDENGDGFTNDDNGAQECAQECGSAAGEPVVLKNRSAFIGPTRDFSVESGIAPEFDLPFERVWDSALADGDVRVGAPPTLFGPGWRSSFSDRLSLSNTAAGVGAPDPAVVTWLHQSGATRFRWDAALTGTDVQGEDGSGARISRVTGTCEGSRPCKIWRVVTRDGDLLEFWEGPNTVVHPFNSQLHARLRFVRPAQMPNFRIALDYEEDLAAQDPVCVDVVPGVSSCTSSRGLLTRVAQEWNDSGVWRRGRSLEFKYLSTTGGFRVGRVDAGATREDTSVTETLANYTYLSDGRLDAAWEGRGCVLPSPTTGQNACLHQRYSYDAALTRAVSSVKVPVSISNTAPLATLEAFTWVQANNRLQVQTHQSRTTSLAFAGETGSTVSWTRNGATEDTTFDRLGNPLSCDSEVCGDPATENVYDSTLSGGVPAYSMGIARRIGRDGQMRWKRYDYDTSPRDFFSPLGLPLIEATVVPAATGANLAAVNLQLDGAGNDFDTVSTGSSLGEIRALVRTYPQSVVSPWVRVVARYAQASQAAGQTAFPFPAPGHTGSGWFYSGTFAARAATPVLPRLTLGGNPTNFDVTVIDRDSDQNGSLNGDSDVLPVVMTRAQQSGSLVRFVRTTITRDFWGRPVTITESTETGTISRTQLDYEPVTSTVGARVRGRLKSVTRYVDPASPAGPVVAWQACPSGVPYDALGEVVCTQVPQAPSVLHVETTRVLNGDNSRTWLTQRKVGSGAGAVLLSSFRTVTGPDVLVSSGTGDGDGVNSETGDGNFVTLAYVANGNPLVDGQISSIIEKTASGAIFSTQSLSYDAVGFPDQVDLTAAGVPALRKRASFDYDPFDGLLTAKRDYLTSSTFVTTTSTYDAARRLDLLEEPDGDAVDSVYGSAGPQLGRLELLNRADTTSAPYFRMWHRVYDRDGNILSIFSGSDSYKVAGYVHDDFGQMKTEDLVSAGATRTYSYDWIGRVSRMSTSGGGPDVQYFHDGLGRMTQVRNALNSTTIFNYAYDASKTPTTCVVAGRTITLTNNNSNGLLTVAGDVAGTTFYEYDLLGRVTSVIRNNGATFACGNLTAVDYTYGSAGQLTDIRYPTGRRVHYDYLDANGDKRRPSAVIVFKGTDGSSTPETIAAGIKWEPYGAPQQWTWAGVSGQNRTVARDLLGRPTSITSSYTALASWESLAYTYDGDSDVLTEVDNSAVHGSGRYTILKSALSATAVTNTSGPHVRTDKLTSWTWNGSSISSPMGATMRRQNLNVGGTVYATGYGATAWEQQMLQDNTSLREPLHEVELTYGPSGNVIEVNRPDASGPTDLTQETTPAEVVLTHGPLGNVETAEVSSGIYTYRMDAAMRRVVKSFPAGQNTSVSYRYGVGPELLEEQKLAGLTVDRAETIWLAGQPIAMLHVPSTGGALSTYHVHTDRMGVPRQYSTATGGRVSRLVLDAFGQAVVTDDNGTTANPPMNMRYPGQMFDSESGLLNNRWRTLVAQTGTYTSPEPLHFETARQFYGPQAYAYASGRPLMYVDPTGAKIDWALSLPPASWGPGPEQRGRSAETGPLNATPVSVTSCVPRGGGFAFDAFVVATDPVQFRWTEDRYRRIPLNPERMSDEEHEECHRDDDLALFARINDVIQTEGFPTLAACQAAYQRFGDDVAQLDAMSYALGEEMHRALSGLEDVGLGEKAPFTIP